MTSTIFQASGRSQNAEMRYFSAEIAENHQLGGGYFRIGLDGCAPLAASQPGQFVMVRGEWERDPLLPRAFSLLTVDSNGRAFILAKTVGRGTALLEKSLPGTRLSILGPLGTHFPQPDAQHVDLLVGGGVGIPPLYMQAERAAALGVSGNSEIIYGGRGSKDLALLDEMRAFGAGLHLTTEDGTMGRPGRVTLELAERIRHHKGRTLRIMACGPNPMLWAVAAIAKEHGVPCFISVEEQMACGIGVCLGCAVPAHSRPFRYVCKDGPVFPSDELVIPTLKAGASVDRPGKETP